MCLPNLAPKNELVTLPYELVITVSMIRPGTMNSMYGMPPISPTRRPMMAPKITKYSDMVMTGGNSVCAQILTIRVISLMTMV